MGMFDSVFIPCPKCEKSMEIQSKAGNCSLSVYSLENAPLKILMDIEGEYIFCSNPECDKTFKLILPRQYKVE